MLVMGYELYYARWNGARKVLVASGGSRKSASQRAISVARHRRYPESAATMYQKVLMSSLVFPRMVEPPRRDVPGVSFLGII